MNDLSALTAISPIDGRYRNKVMDIANCFSEFNLIKTRLTLENKYFKEVVEATSQKLSNEQLHFLEKIQKDFSLSNAEEIKKIEERNNHDVKAVEIYLREKIAKTSLSDFSEFIHIGLTSEDINNIAYRLMIKDAGEIINSHLDGLLKSLNEKVASYKDLVILGRTHGQPAIPTTLGKEIAVFAKRLESEIKILKNAKLSGKLNGAIGNFSAMSVAFPKVDWNVFSKKFVESLGLEYNPITTQINSFEDVIYFFQALQRINGVLIDLDQDFWRYISDGWLAQQNQKDQVGSSTMPQKINPIDFENSEGNLHLANGLIEVFSSKLPISRLQRDLSNSTIIRNAGLILAYCAISYQSTQKGLNKVEPNLEIINQDLNRDWSILAEALQTILRREKITDAYDVLKNLTRGHSIDQNEWLKLIDSLPVTDAVKNEMRQITPQNYIGKAKDLI